MYRKLYKMKKGRKDYFQGHDLYPPLERGGFTLLFDKQRRMVPCLAFAFLKALAKREGVEVKP